MSTVGAALRITDRSTKKGTTIMPHIVDTTPTIYEQRLNESGHGFVNHSQHGNPGTFDRQTSQNSCYSLSSFSYSTPDESMVFSGSAVRTGLFPVMCRTSVFTIPFMRCIGSCREKHCHSVDELPHQLYLQKPCYSTPAPQCI